jgi:hypothetical protein
MSLAENFRTAESKALRASKIDWSLSIIHHEQYQ